LAAAYRGWTWARTAFSTSGIDNKEKWVGSINSESTRSGSLPNELVVKKNRWVLLQNPCVMFLELGFHAAKDRDY
jgi:hypothetical protein